MARADHAQRSRLAMVLGTVFGASLISLGLPEIALDTRLADAVIAVTDTASWPQLAFLSAAAVVVVVGRRGIDSRRQRVEVAAFAVALLIFLAGNAVLNEFVVKPLFAIPRPNIEALAASGSLGSDFTNGAALYDVGDKGARRQTLAGILPTVETPGLSDRVRAHWIHETGYSFPSGHATAAMTLASLMVAAGLAWHGGGRRFVAVIVFPLWAVAVVYSRVLLQVHTAGDVIAGTLAGLGWGLLAYWMVGWSVARYLPPNPADESPPR